MFVIMSWIMAGLFSLAFPPLAFVTIPAFIIWFDSKAREARRLRRCRDTFVVHQTEADRLKALRSFK